MKSSSGKIMFIFGILATFIVAGVLVGTVAGKSVYLASEHHTALFDAWNINPDGTVTYQATYSLNYATDPAGIAIDADSETIFITSEFSGGVEMVDPVTLTYLGVSSGPEDLAGIDVDERNDIVYSVQRFTDNLYIFDWDPVSQILTEQAQIDLPNCGGAFGIALDELRDILWVADAGSESGDRDIFEVTGLGTGPVDIEVISGSFDSILGLFDHGGNLVDTDDDGGVSLLSRFSGVTPDNGIVRFGITGYSDFSFVGGHSQTGGYQIAVWPSGSSPPNGPQVTESEDNTTFLDRNIFASAGEIVINGSMGSIESMSMVRAYDTNTWMEDTSKSFEPSHIPIDVAVDRVRNLIYTVSIMGGAWVPGGTGSQLLSKYDVQNQTETTVDMGFPGVGVSVDEVTGYAYVTGGAEWGDNVSVWDPSTYPFTLIQDTGPIGNPAGIAIGNVSFNQLNLAKNDTVQGYGVYIGQTFTYEITYDNSDNDFDVTNVTIVDQLPPELDFVSETLNQVSGTGVYDSAERTVTWNIGTLPAGYQGGLIELVVKVNQNAVGEDTIYNYCTIDSDQTPPTTEEGEDPDNPDPGEPGTYIIPCIPVSVDIKPQSCPNPLNVKKQGLISIAILGTEDFDVHEIDITTIYLEGVAPLRSAYEDVTTPVLGDDECECTTEGPDGQMDLTLKFDMQEVVAAIGEVSDGDILILTLTGALNDGTPIEGADCIRVIKKIKQ